MNAKTRFMLLVGFLAGTACTFGCSNDVNNTPNTEGQCTPACTGNYVCDASNTCVCPDGVECTPEDEDDDYVPETKKECKPACEGKYVCNAIFGTCECPVGVNCEADEEDDKNPEDDEPDVTLPCSAPDADGDTISDELETKFETDAGITPNINDEDSDGDTIPDRIEAGTDNCSGQDPVDTDGDLIPDYLDTDSDDNMIPDNVEVGPDPLNPLDSDGDTVPDYLDEDNDNDGFFDLLEVIGLSDPNRTPIGYVAAKCPAAPEVPEGGEGTEGGNNGDGTGEQPPSNAPEGDPNAEKYDVQGNGENPFDCDKDSIPDYLDTDSDNDGISDTIEGMYFANGYYARYMLDADGDGINDLEEGLIDTDGDGTPNHIDIDSDNDGLSDDYEAKFCQNGQCLDPYNPDSDGDSHTDMIEIGAQTSPLDPADDPVTAGNFVFVVPYKGETSPKKQTLSFETGIQTVDMFFNIDSSTTMNDEINSLKNSLKTLLTNLQCKDYGKTCTENSDCDEFANAICSSKGKCIVSPSYGNGCLDDMQTGLGWYSSDSCFRSVVPIGNDPDATVAQLGKSPADTWGFREPPYQMPLCAILGNSLYEGKQYCNTNACTCTPRETSSCAPLKSGPNCVTGNPDRVTCVGYRKDAIKLYLQAFDEEECRNNTDKTNANRLCQSVTDDKGVTTGSVMKAHKVRWIGLYSQGNSDTGAINAMKTVSDNIGKHSGTLDSNGNPFSYNTVGADFATKVQNGIMDIVRNMPVQVTSTVEDVDVANVKNLVKELSVNITDAGSQVQGKICQKIESTNIVSGTYQGIKDLLPGKVVCYDVIPVDSQSLFPATREPQVFQARVKVMGDGSVLNSGIAYFLVPPVFEQGDTVN